jgi:hypothetical protein
MAGSPPVSRCDVTGCFYNKTQMCHAPAINVGGSHPSCDTFVPDAARINRDAGSMVGACHVVDCKFNSERTCGASAIHVAPHADHADCATFLRH